MIFQGLKLTILGMGVVFCFLILLMLLIHISSNCWPRLRKRTVSAVVKKTPDPVKSILFRRQPETDRHHQCCGGRPPGADTAVITAIFNSSQGRYR